MLLKACTQYLSGLDRNGREDIVKVIVENSPMAEALSMLSMLNDGVIDPEQASIKFLYGLRIFVDENKINDSILLFFQQHFLNLERIKPSKYQDLELTRSEYLILISDYLKVQSNIF
ncbi:hypothetical protein [Pedobacter sp.]|uniref:hypothetical protein n=1 Tax=Pedobacter sp. TaxID=1411316 RepID=UPI003D7F4A43